VLRLSRIEACRRAWNVRRVSCHVTEFTALGEFREYRNRQYRNSDRVPVSADPMAATCNARAPENRGSLQSKSAMSRQLALRPGSQAATGILLLESGHGEQRAMQPMALLKYRTSSRASVDRGTRKQQYRVGDGPAQAASGNVVSIDAIHADLTKAGKQVPDAHRDYRVSFERLAGSQSIAGAWKQIEDRATAPFFLSWAWVSTWLDTLQPDTLVAKVTLDDELIAIGLFTESVSRRRFLIRAKQLRLHQVGDNLLDQIWVEYNNLICLPGHDQQAMLAAIRGLEASHSQWDEIVISMMPRPLADHIATQCKRVSLEQHHRCFAAELAQMRQDGKNYLESLNANSRYQVRHSIRLYTERFGPLHLDRAEDAGTAIDFFREAGPLHIQRWKDSGYLNPSFMTFHEALISRFVNNGVELLRLRSGNMTVAVLYYHVVGKRVYFYLHGLTYDSDPKLKPGLVAHSLAAQYFLDRGMELYDFMGGYSRYKLQLAEETEPLVTVRLQRPRIRFAVENFGRRLVRQFRRQAR